MKNINPTLLKIGDIVDTTDMHPLAETIRWKTWGPKYTFDLNKGTHTGIICDRGGGLYYVAEMLGNGLCMSELQKYDHKPGSWFGHFTRVGRHPLMENLGMRDKLNTWIIQQHSFGVKYGYEGLLKFLFPKMQDNPYTWICSQFAAVAYNLLSIPLPIGWPGPDMNFDQVTPMMWQLWTDLKDVKFI
jgi:hypothetical protein